MELRNAITRGRLDELRPEPLVADFTWADAAAGSLPLGRCPAGHLVRKTTIEIVVAFNGGTRLTVGDLAAQGRLQAAANNLPEERNTYEVENNYEYASAEIIYLFFPSGTPTIGSGRVIVYFD
jgi:hypothetical protein